jgi:DNA-binding response OmpR family regulator
MNNKPTLLYAEDDKESQENYAFILNEYFSKIYLASNGEEALTLFHKHLPDMLLLDISMPLLNGLDLVEIIRKTHPKIPIIMLTAHSDKERLLKAVDLKLDGYLLKPISVAQLKEALLSQIDRKQKKDIIYFGTDLIWNGDDLFFKNQLIKLTKKERFLIQYLCKHYGQYVLHDDLIIHIWNDEIPDFRHNKNLIQLVYRLNKKINPMMQSHHVFIENSYKHGYKIFSDKTPSSPEK